MADDDEIVEEEQAKHELIDEDVAEKVAEGQLPPSKYEVMPGLGDKFQAQNVRDIINQVQTANLQGRQYKVDQAGRWAMTIANAVRTCVQELNMKRYKIVVTTTLIEMKGAGVKCGQRCLWDPETDDYADNLYRNDSLFCYTACYGLYMY